MKIRLLPEAERDIEIGADFYESQNPGLGSYAKWTINRRRPVIGNVIRVTLRDTD